MRQAQGRLPASSIKAMRRGSSARTSGTGRWHLAIHQGFHEHRAVFRQALHRLVRHQQFAACRLGVLETALANRPSPGISRSSGSDFWFWHARSAIPGVRDMPGDRQLAEEVQVGREDALRRIHGSGSMIAVGPLPTKYKTAPSLLVAPKWRTPLGSVKKVPDGRFSRLTSSNRSPKP